MEKTPRHLMRPADITGHYKDVCSLSTRLGIDPSARARIAGVAEQSMKGYGALDGTKAHRRIPADTLDRLREAAISAYWVIAETPYRSTVRYQVGDPEHVVPTLVALRADGSECERHIHPLRVLERAENHGGRVVDTAGAPVEIELDEAAALRSRWRKAAHLCRWAHNEMTAEEILCAAADCCLYSLPRIASEFGLWAIQPTMGMVERLEAAVADLQRRAA